MTPRTRFLLAAGLLSAFLSPARAAPDDAKGLWMTAEKDAVLEFKPCADAPSALCGQVVWDKDAGQPRDTCGAQIARLERYDNDAWRDGWVYDPRDSRKYKGALRVKSGELQVRAFVGTELLGQTERLQRVAEIPAAPACRH
ncbi:DUF2147 domain-containing protein [Paracidovorax cattleyae]|uniref:Uncharacterized conserved protein, DUF2147 family n=1 Tax=Paracidovorax cattleyae TaxID=80868 RepID=A0A1H0W673_9BURK|nr:DUF2147 domain-containing protein [Paracidovorax cattleyae]AVS73378.1 DUF2147 domain-containing protein [Paracidovorax cattleyae]MBF9267013.1 DUF2147 domain-containing protein [Paracidovorax cattleyae]SDP86098.1 Uncharacterized conserved protein, DUF2147 family [Paracidovorax cattleyae]